MYVRPLPGGQTRNPNLRRRDMWKFLIGGDSDSDKMLRWILGLFLSTLAAGAALATLLAS